MTGIYSAVPQNRVVPEAQHMPLRLCFARQQAPTLQRPASATGPAAEALQVPSCAAARLRDL